MCSRSHYPDPRAVRAVRAVGIGALGVLALLAVACGSRKDGDGGGFTVGKDLAIGITPAQVTFGAVAVGKVETQDVTLRHTGQSGQLELREVALVGASADLTITGPELTVLEPEQETTITVRYEPTDAVHDEGTVRIKTNIAGGEEGGESYQVPIITLAQTARLVPGETVVEFGDVPTGQRVTRVLTVRNLGDLAITLGQVAPSVGSPADFAVDEAPDEGSSYEPGDSFDVTLGYGPAGEDYDEGTLQVSFESERGPETLEVTLTGNEVTADLVATPDPVDFDMQVAGYRTTQTLTIRNEGTFPLEITGVDVFGSGAWVQTVDIEEEDLAAMAMSLDPGAETTLEVGFTPDADMPPSLAPLAYVRFFSNDPDEGGVQLVPVTGKRRGAGLEIVPPDILYFGYVGVGGTAVRQALLYNSGTKPISILRVGVEGKFELAEEGSWGPTLSEPVAYELASGEVRPVEVRFSNDGGDWQIAWGKLSVESNDTKRPQWDVLLNARWAEGGSCVAQLVPDQQDLGVLEGAATGSARFELVNIGTESCRYQGASISDCDGTLGCAYPEDPENAVTTSAYWSVAAEPEPGVRELAPGESETIEVLFRAPEAQAEPMTYPGLMTLRLTAPVDGQPVLTQIPQDSSWKKAPNLTAVVAMGQLVVLPPEHDFGIVPVGCKTETLVVTASNVGLAPLALTDWELLDCPPTFKMEDYPVLDEPDDATGELVKTIAPGKSVEFSISYAPQDETESTCRLAISSTDREEPLEVSLVGLGAFDAHKTDVFTSSDSQVVDVLFVVDDSGSMYEEQDNLAESFDAFIQKAADWHSDYQIGVTTTTVSFPDGGKLRGEPPFVTAINWEKFRHNVYVGTTGSGIEQGLWAAKVAISPPLTDRTDEPCQSDLDCQFLHMCWPDGTCGGRNRDFLREDASLEIVIVSDEDDQSPEALDAYLNYFRGIKGWTHPGNLHVHAIVGPPGGCYSGFGSASAGLRYYSMAKDTGGVLYSICEADFAKGLETIGDIAFASRMEYFLTQRPVPTSIAVMIDGIPCPRLAGGTFNWEYDAEANAVQLLDSGICIAEPGELVEIGYELLCYASAE